MSDEEIESIQWIDYDLDLMEACDYSEPYGVGKMTHQMLITTNLILSRILGALNDLNGIKKAGS